MNYTYGIVGNGNMARHFMKYLSLEKITFVYWSRNISISPIDETLKDCNTIILLISDNAIESFINKNLWLKGKTIVHFSGALHIDGVFSYHPLMTFSTKLYSLNEYREIPFIGEKNQPSFSSIFPLLKNRYYTIKPGDKPLYHALCVVSGNFTNIIWQKTFSDFESKLNIPRAVLFPYLEKSFNNIKESPFSSLTGPIKRDDRVTIKKNIKALKPSVWKKIYRLFIKAYKGETFKGSNLDSSQHF